MAGSHRRVNAELKKSGQKRKHDEAKSPTKEFSPKRQKPSDKPMLFSKRKLRSASRTWATSDGIARTLNQELGNTAYIVHPELGSIHSIFDSNEAISTEAAVNFAKELVGYSLDEKGQAISNGIISDQKAFTKPVVAILNATGVKGKKKKASSEGGSHWLAFVALPREYKNEAGLTIRLDKEKIFLIDSLYPDRAFPQKFQEVLSNGCKHDVHAPKSEVDDTLVTRTHYIRAAFPSADWVHLNDFKVQQVGFNDCGWWSVDNIRQVIRTGSAQSIIQATQNGPTDARALREQYPDLDKTEFPVRALRR